VIDEIMRMGEWWNDTDRGKPKYSKWKPVTSTKTTMATTITVIMNWI
jgi:hypothetical protein